MKTLTVITLMYILLLPLAFVAFIAALVMSLL